MNYIQARKHTTDQRIAENKDTKEYALPSGMHKYQMLETLRRLAPRIGLTDGAIAQYKIYLDYSDDRDWLGGNLCICWVSVGLMAKLLCRTERQVRNNNQKLLNAGIIAYSVAGNHRRGGMRNKDGTIKWASGVDLKPILERWEALSEMDETIQRELQESLVLKKEISKLRRKIIDTLPPEMAEDAELLLNQRTSISWSLQDCQCFYDELEQLNREVVAWYQEQAANDVEDFEAFVVLSEDQNNDEYFRDVLQIFPPLIQKNNTREQILVQPLADIGSRGDTPHASIPSPHSRQHSDMVMIKTCENQEKGRVLSFLEAKNFVEACSESLMSQFFRK